MAVLSSFKSYIGSVGVADVIDILIIAFLLYRTLLYLDKTNSLNLAKGVLIILFVLAIATIFGLSMLSFLIRKAVELGAIGFIILFQPELRRMLERIGSKLSKENRQSGSKIETAIEKIVTACSDMSESKTGALIVIERREKQINTVSTGTEIDSEISVELLKNLFYDKAPLHDGAVIIRNCRIAAAGCILPLTQDKHISKELGMRHRAGIGVSESCDAIVIIVSEETGSISVAIDGGLKRHQSTGSLREILQNELMLTEQDSKNNFVALLKKVFMVETDETKKSV